MTPDTETLRGLVARATKGPWSLPHFATPETNCKCGYVLVETCCGAVATVHWSGDGRAIETGDNPPFSEAVANAELISTAPQLAQEVLDLRGEVERLREALGSIASLSTRPDEPEWHSGEIARAALTRKE